MKVRSERKKRKISKARDEKERRRSLEPQPVRIGKASGVRDVDRRNYGTELRLLHAEKGQDTRNSHSQQVH